MIKLDAYKSKIMWHVFTLNNRADMTAVLDFIEEEHGGYTDGFGNLLFDSEEQEMMFVLRWA